MSDVEVCLPSGAVGEGGDLAKPTTDLLRELNLLPTKEALASSGGWGEAISGPAPSIALLEAGATAASKWWAAGLGVSVVAAWGSVTTWWTSETGDVRTAALVAAAAFSSAAVLGIAYLLGSDVRGRAAVQTETIRARATLATAFVQAARELHQPPPPGPDSSVGEEQPAGTTDTSAVRLSPLAGQQVVHLGRHSHDTAGWQALALLADGTAAPTYLLVKGNTHEWVPAEEVEFPFVPAVIDLETLQQRPPSEPTANGQTPTRTG